MSVLDEAKRLLGKHFDRQFSDPCDPDSAVQGLDARVSALRSALILVIEAVEADQARRGR